jgi:hypothetical protein
MRASLSRQRHARQSSGAPVGAVRSTPGAIPIAFNSCDDPRIPIEINRQRQALTINGTYVY